MSQKTIDGLNDKQIQAIDLLASGYTVTDAAKEIGVERETLSRWKTGDPHFIVALNERREALWAAGFDKLRGNLDAAHARLAELIDHENPDVAIKAIATVFKGAQIYPKNGRVFLLTHNQVERQLLFDAM